MERRKAALLNFNRLLMGGGVCIFHRPLAAHSTVWSLSTFQGEGAGLTWAHTEDLVEVGADAHLLVELGGLGQVGAGLEVRHGEDVCPPLAGSWKTADKKPSGTLQ